MKADRKIRICSIACQPLSSVEGPSTHIRELHEGLSRHDAVIDLWLPDLGLPVKTEIDGVTLRPLRVPNIPILRYFLFDIFLFLRLVLEFMARRRRPDLLYVRQSYSTVLPGILARIYRLPMFVEVNGILRWDLESRNASALIRACSRLGERISYSAARHVICVTDGIHRRLDEWYGLNGKTVTVRNGVNTDTLKPLPKLECRRALGLSESAFIVGYLGCFTPWDGIGRLAEVAPDLIRDNDTVRFLLVGDGHCYREVTERVQELGLADYFDFPGFVETNRLNQYIASFDIAVAPYIPANNDMGRSSLKCLEYLACGVPTLVADVPEMDYVAEAGGGRLFRCGDDAHLLQSIQELMQDSNARAAMATAARQHVEKNCTWQHTADTTWDLIRSALEK